MKWRGDVKEEPDLLSKGVYMVVDQHKRTGLRLTAGIFLGAHLWGAGAWQPPSCHTVCVCNLVLICLVLASSTITRDAGNLWAGIPMLNLLVNA